ncbi:hypothetical protein AVEN_196736-1 [Araneus ventricosus]|uniref:Uncharacterized protein n=1 Tax=Araneus ventricosus TaxID=182803 RepID=A0A4Y2H989_ARAVE|nr:hypothetical protein AVEN_196736-1 [Araneus ventricosus]
MRTFSSLTVTKKVDVKRESMTYSKDTKIPEVISKELGNHMQNLHAAIQRVSLTANMLHSNWHEMDCNIDVARVTKTSYIRQSLRAQTKLQASFCIVFSPMSIQPVWLP